MEVTTEFPKSKDAILSPNGTGQKNPSNLSSHTLSEMGYICPINLNYDLLKQALSLENSTQNNRNLQTTSWKKLPWKLGQLRCMAQSTGKPSNKDPYIPLQQVVFCRSQSLSITYPLKCQQCSGTWLVTIFRRTPMRDKEVGKESQNKNQKHACILQCHIRETLKPAFACTLLFGIRKQHHPCHLLCLNILKYRVNLSPTAQLSQRLKKDLIFHPREVRTVMCTPQKSPV